MKITPEDYEEFLATAESTPSADIPQPILKDLVGSRSKLVLNYTLSAIAGYLVSLMVCAQCSVGFTDLAWKTSALIHHIPDPWCPILCGVVFGIFPFLFSSLWITRFQHRYLLFRMPWVPLLIPILANVAMSSYGPSHGREWMILWFMSASLTPYLAELVLGFGLKQKEFHA